MRSISLHRSEPHPNGLWIFVLIPPLLLLFTIIFINRHESKRRKLISEARTEKIKALENAFLSATDSRIQLRSLRDISKETFRVQIQVSEKDVTGQLKKILNPDAQKIAFPIVHKLIVNSASTHTPITAKEAIDVLNVLRAYYDK